MYRYGLKNVQMWLKEFTDMTAIMYRHGLKNVQIFLKNVQIRLKECADMF